MDFTRINSLIERHRVLTGMSSLPFVARTANGESVCWFNYNVEQTGDALGIRISGVFSVDGEYRVAERRVAERVSVMIEEYDEPELPERAYLRELEALYANYSEEGMTALLRRAEMAPLLPAYARVREIIAGEREE